MANAGPEGPALAGMARPTRSPRAVAEATSPGRRTPGARPALGPPRTRPYAGRVNAVGDPRGCFFCDGRPLTKEHVWPQWVRRLRGRDGMARYHAQHVALDREATTCKWRDVDLNLQVRAV